MLNTIIRAEVSVGSGVEFVNLNCYNVNQNGVISLGLIKTGDPQMGYFDYFEKIFWGQMKGGERMG